MHELEYDKIIYQIKSLNFEFALLEEKEFNGRLDLNYRLSEAYKLVEKSQKEKFSNNYFPKSDEQQNKSPDHDQQIIQDKKQTATALKPRKSGWQKSIFKEVSKKTHPDALISFRQEDKVFYSEIYIKCKDYFNDKKDADLLVTANEVRVKPKKITEEHRMILVCAVSEKSQKINLLKNNTYVIWDGLPEDQKKVFLENYLRQQGFNISEENLEEVIKSKRPNRKPGERPNNFIAERRRLKRAKE